MNKGFENFEKIAKKANENELNKQIKEVCLKAIKSQNAKAIYLAACEFKEDLDEEILKKMAKAIVKVGKEEDMRKFAEEIMNISIVDLIIDYADIVSNEDECESE